MQGLLTQGDPRLETPCIPATPGDPELPGLVQRLQDALLAFRESHGFGRAIAAPQLGIMQRFICFHLGATPFALINPEITWRSDDTMEVWDDCLSLPDIVVRVRRYRSISVSFLDEHGRRRHWRRLDEEMSELVQHEMDHLDGILMTARAVGADAVQPVARHAELVGAGRPRHRLSLEAIREACDVIDPVFLDSPQYEDGGLSERLGCALTLKVETANPIRSFKGRGADYFLHRLDREGHGGLLVCASAGNFGQALAFACRRRDRPLVVFASVHANPQKIERMKHLGADVRLAGEDFDAAKAAARAFAEEKGAKMVEDGLEASISEGAGTLAVELLRNQAMYDEVLVPLGNGALLNGVARWIKAASPATRVVGVCSAGADATEKSWRAGRLIESSSVSTIADGVAVRVPIPEALEDMKGLVDDVVLVEDATIRRAMALLFDTAGLVTEPAGAIGVGALLAHPEFAGHRVATVLCGSNVDPALAHEWLLGAG